MNTITGTIEWNGAELDYTVELTPADSRQADRCTDLAHADSGAPYAGEDWEDAEQAAIFDAYGQNEREDGLVSVAKDSALTALVDHILAMEGDAYLEGHPEWHELVDEARAVNGGDQ